MEDTFADKIIIDIVFNQLKETLKMHYSELLYLDPGSGSILVQMLVAALLGAGLLVRSQWAKIKQLFGKTAAEEETKTDAGDDFLDE